MQVDAVFTCLRVISNAIIKMGDLYGYTVDYTDDDLPYRKPMRQQPAILTSTFGGPGVQMQYDGRRRLVMSLGLFGEAFMLTLTRDRLGYPTALEVLHPAFISVERAKVSTPTEPVGSIQYWYGNGVHKVQLPTEDITHVPFMALPGAERGLSSIEYGGVAFALAIAAMEFGQRWFAQGASPSFLLTTDAKLGQAEIDRIAEKFLIEHSGLQSAHLPLVIDSGMKAQKISSTPDEAQFINTLEYSRMCIASWFGLPGHLIGAQSDKGNVWGKTVQEQGFEIVDFTLSGYIVPLEEAHSSFLPAGQFAAFNVSEIQKANAADLAAEIMGLRQTQSASINDIRVRKLHWPPVPGGDQVIAPLASNVAPASATAVDQAADTEDDAGANSGGNS